MYLFLEKGEERGREREKDQCVVASHMPPTGDLACNPGMGPDWESNWQLWFTVLCATPARAFFFFKFKFKFFASN